MTFENICEIIVTIIGALFLCFVLGIIAYNIMTYPEKAPDGLDDTKWQTWLNSCDRMNRDSETYKKVEKAKNKEYKKYERENRITFHNE